MSRFRALPPDYRPGLAYWLRTADEGGELRASAELRGSRVEAVRGRRHCIVLVHGYNNHAGEAARAYLGFRSRQRALYEDVVPEKLEEVLGDVHWPGDSDWPGPVDRLDFLVYPYAVGTARKTASVLADALAALPLEQVDFVGHSLGCRVVLETALLLHERGHPLIGRICLMAAAVPCAMVEPGGRFEALLQQLTAEGVRVAVLSSTSDKVLRFAFPPGQAIAGEPSLCALGRHGAPVDMPGRGAFVADVSVPGAGHGDYWGHSGTAAAQRATRAAAEFLRLGERARTIEARAAPAVRAVAEARGLGPVRYVAGGD